MSRGGARIGSGPRKTLRDRAEHLRVVPVPLPPDGLTDRERRVWNGLARQVTALEVYTPSDAAAFVSWVRTEALLEAAVAGEVIDVDRAGKPKRASLGAIVQLTRTAAMLGQRFRCDPASRGAVPAPPAPPLGEHDPDDLRPLPPLKIVPRPGPR